MSYKTLSMLGDSDMGSDIFPTGGGAKTCRCFLPEEVIDEGGGVCGLLPRSHAHVYLVDILLTHLSNHDDNFQDG